jgi:hypothetical protein
MKQGKSIHPTIACFTRHLSGNEFAMVKVTNLSGRVTSIVYCRG